MILPRSFPIRLALIFIFSFILTGLKAALNWSQVISTDRHHDGGKIKEKKNYGQVMTQGFGNHQSKFDFFSHLIQPLSQPTVLNICELLPGIIWFVLLETKSMKEKDLDEL
jgi:hypothetical protein